MACPTNDTLLAHVQAGSSGSHRVAEHLVGCTECRELVALIGQTSLAPGVEARPGPEDPSVGERIGRYVIVAAPKRGGMGAVYQAIDPELDRTVAIKLMRTDLRAPAQRLSLRVLQEAHALARIDHPNVLAIHDIGVWRDHLFLATAWVPGQTLGEWLQQPKTPADVVASVIQAARGLDAMHRAGLVHRDVKPANIMIDRAGRVRVLDLGLALSADDAVGDIGGTPRYMAPEQRRGHSGPASDQWALCLCLYEALCGDDVLDKELGELRAGRVRWESVRPRRRWRRAVQRGLSLDPSKRFGSLGELADALGGRSTSTYATAVAIVVAGVGLTGALASARTPDPCEALIGDFPEFVEPLEAAPVETDAARARIVAELEAYSERWAQAGQAACFAAQRDTPRRLLRATTCLKRIVRRVDGLVARWADGASPAAARALTSIAELPPPRSCLVADDGSASIPSVQVAEIQRQLDYSAVAWSSGDLDRAWAWVVELPDRAAATGDRGLEAEALLLAGQIQYARGEAGQAQRMLRESRYAAEASGSDRIAAKVSLLLTRVLALHDRDAKGAEQATRMARATIARLRNPPDLVTAFHRIESRRLSAAGDTDGALSHARQAHERSRVAYGEDDYRTVVAAAALATEHAARGEEEPARALLLPAVAWVRHNLGPSHVTTAQMEGDLGNLYLAIGDNERAIALHTASVVTLEAARGSHHPETGQAHFYAASSLLAGDRIELARVHARASLEAFERSYGSDSSKVAWVGYLLATIAAAENDHAEALRRLETSLPTLERQLGSRHPALCSVLDAMGGSWHAIGRDEDARVALTRSLALQPPTAVEPIANGRILLGSVLLAQGSRGEAVQLFEAAVRSLTDRPSAQSRELLARAQEGLVAAKRARGSLR